MSTTPASTTLMPSGTIGLTITRVTLNGPNAVSTLYATMTVGQVTPPLTFVVTPAPTPQEPSPAQTLTVSGPPQLPVQIIFQLENASTFQPGIKYALVGVSIGDDDTAKVFPLQLTNPSSYPISAAQPQLNWGIVIPPTSHSMVNILTNGYSGQFTVWIADNFGNLYQFDPGVINNPS